MYEEQSFTSVEKIIKEIGLEDDGEHLYLYRGHSDKEHTLIPSIYRRNEWISNEDKLVREIVSRCPEDFSNHRTAFEKLVKMQHYDLPTRLLDVTDNPLVALYFSCIFNPKKDGELLVFKLKKSEVKYFDSDTVSVLSNISWMNVDFYCHPNYTKERFNKDDDENSIRLLHSIKNEKPHFKHNIEPKHLNSVICVKPMMDNQRLIRQDGSFFLFGINEKKTKCVEVPDDWKFYPKNNRIIIKARNKTRVLKLLSMMGITKAKLFPEIDQVSAFVKEGLGWKAIKPSSRPFFKVDYSKIL